MSGLSLKLLSDARQVVRLVYFCVLALGVAAVGMAINGWHAPTLVMGMLGLAVASLLVFQVHRAVHLLGRQSAATRQLADQAEEHYVGVLWDLASLAESSERYTDGHSERVGRLSQRIGERLHLDEELCNKMDLAGRLHDIGMLAIPTRLVNQKNRIGAGAFNAIKKHAEIGYHMLQPLTSLADVLSAVRHHHERMNGTGYPDGLTGQEIPVVARIVAVADAYDAMTHDRPYRPALTPISAVRELRRCCPSGYDPACVEALAELVNVPELEQVSLVASEVA